MAVSIASVKHAGGVLVAGSDWNVSSMNPFEGMEVAITRQALEGEPGPALTPQQRVTLQDMLEAYTINGARAAFVEDELGSITEGKRADLVVIDRDPFAIEAAELSEVRVLRTLLDGREVYRAAPARARGDAIAAQWALRAKVAKASVARPPSSSRSWPSCIYLPAEPPCPAGRIRAALAVAPVPHPAPALAEADALLGPATERRLPFGGTAEVSRSVAEIEAFLENLAFVILIPGLPMSFNMSFNTDALRRPGASRLSAARRRSTLR